MASFFESTTTPLKDELISKELAETKQDANELYSILVQSFKVASSQQQKYRQVQLQMYSCTIDVDQHLTHLQQHMERVIMSVQLENRKCIVPDGALVNSKFVQTKKMLKLEAICQKHTHVDVRLVRSFRVWQKALLNIYLDLIRQNRWQDEESLMSCRFLFLAKKVQLRLRRAFARWRMVSLHPAKDYSVTHETQEAKSNLRQKLNGTSRQILGFLKLVNLRNFKSIPLNQLQCRRVADAFLIWKNNIDMEMCTPYDNQEILVALQKLSQIQTKHRQISKAYAFASILESNQQQSRKQKYRDQLQDHAKVVLRRFQAPPLVDTETTDCLLQQFLRDRIIRMEFVWKAECFKEWKLQDICGREKLSQSRQLTRQIMRQQPQKRRWTDPKPIEKSNELSIKAGITLCLRAIESKQRRTTHHIDVRLSVAFNQWKSLCKTKDTGHVQRLRHLVMNITHFHKVSAFQLWKTSMGPAPPRGPSYTQQMQKINHSIITTQSMINAEIDRHIKEKRRGHQQAFQNIKQQATMRQGGKVINHYAHLDLLGSILPKLFFKAKSTAFAQLAKSASKDIKSSRNFNQRLEILQQEKDILEEEYTQAIFMGEELEVQMQQVQGLKCDNHQQITDHGYHSQPQPHKQKQRSPQEEPGIIAEEPIESSMSNIEMSKSEKSLQKPLQMARGMLEENDKKAGSAGNMSKEKATASRTDHITATEDSKNQQYSGEFGVEADVDKSSARSLGIGDEYLEFITMSNETLEREIEEVTKTEDREEDDFLQEREQLEARIAVLLQQQQK